MAYSVARAGAAALQGIQQLLQDGKFSVAHHLAAWPLSNSRRKLLVDMQDKDETAAFKAFVNRTEDILEEHTEAREKDLRALPSEVVSK
jgi:hypothetical protein